MVERKRETVYFLVVANLYFFVFEYEKTFDETKSEKKQTNGHFNEFTSGKYPRTE